MPAYILSRTAGEGRASAGENGPNLAARLGRMRSVRGRLLPGSVLPAGPYATMLMAKAGADVIKIEPPQGEPLRRRAPPGKSTTFPIAMLNGNKRAITLNLKHERGRELLFRMVEKGDMLLENFAPGVMDRLGVGYEVLSRINPRLVYASGTGYGLVGPGSRQSGDGSDGAGDGRADQRHRPRRPAAAEGRPGGRRFPLRHPPLRRDDHRAVRARAHRQGPHGRGGDAGGGLRDPDLAARSLLADRQGAAAHRQRQPRPGADQRLPDQGRLCRDEPRGRGALAQPVEGDGPRGTARRPALQQPRRPGQEPRGNRRR